MLTAVTTQPIMTEGRRTLIAWMRRWQVTQKAMAKALGVSQASVSRWLSGRSRPAAFERAMLQNETGIAVTDWDTGRERAKRRRQEKRKKP